MPAVSQHHEHDVEAVIGRSRTDSIPTSGSPSNASEGDLLDEIGDMAEKGMRLVFLPVWERMKPVDVPVYPTWRKSLVDVFYKKGYNIPFVLVPLALAWTSHFEVEKWGNTTSFILCFIAMIPLQKIFDWGGDKIGLFLGKEPRDLLVITLSNAIEAALAIILLFKCQLRLLQSTVIGVVLLHLLLIPGVAFFIQGAQIYEQKLHQFSNLNHSLLMIGVLGILVPTVFFAALDRGSIAAASSDQSGLPAPFVPLVSDIVRKDMLQMSRGIAIMLLLIYITGCLYRHNVLPLPGHPDHIPPPRANTLRNGHHSSIPINSPVKSHASSAPNELTVTSPRPESEVNPWVCVLLVLVAVAFMGVTAEFLVQSIETLLETSDIQTEWFGLVLLPIVSFSADGAVVIWNFSVALCRYAIRRARFRRARQATLAQAAMEQQALGATRPLTSQHILEDPEHAVYVEEPSEIGFHREPSAASLPASTSRFRGKNKMVLSPNTAVVHRDTTTRNVGSMHQGSNTQMEEDILELPWVSEFAHGRPIDLSIQFMLWWLPFLVLLGWWTHRPMHLLFDYFEVGMLLGSCILVNYVTVDEKTNMSEGLTMISLYTMIALAAWFYPGQPQVAFMLNCPGTVAEAVAQGAEGSGENLVKLL